MKQKKQLCGSLKPYVNKYGTHINVYYSEQIKDIPEGTPDDSPLIKDSEGERVAKLTYHVSTHSITIGKYIKEEYTAEDIALEFVNMMKTDWFKDYIKETAKVSEVSTKPIRCKQLGKHFV